MQMQTFYTRAEHGALPVRVASGGRFEVLSLDGTSTLSTHETKGDLLASITGTKWWGDARWPTYFQLNVPVSRPPPPGGGILDMFALDPRLTTRPQAPRVRRQTALTVAPQPALGIALAVRGKEVRKLLFAGFGLRMARGGYDPEEVLQEVYRGILARNNGICPFDPRKSSFGHYVHLVTECILSNYHRKESRRREVEQIGLPAREGGTVDVAVAAERRLGNDERWGDGGDALASRNLHRHLTRLRMQGMDVDPLAERLVPFLMDGMGRREIAKQLGVSEGRVTQALSSLRTHAVGWAK